MGSLLNVTEHNGVKAGGHLYLVLEPGAPFQTVKTWENLTMSKLK